MSRLLGFAIAFGLAVSACGPGVVDVPQDDTGTTSAGDSSSTGAPATTVTSSTANTDAGTDDTTDTDPATTDATTDPAADASTSAGSTGEAWTEVAEQTYADARCLQDEPAAWIEIYPEEDDGSCAASPETTNVIVIAVQAWDGLGGTFQVGPDGPASANGKSLDMLTGFVTIEVSAPWTLESVTYELVGDDLMLSGAAELGPCVDPRTASPCE